MGARPLNFTVRRANMLSGHVFVWALAGLACSAYAAAALKSGKTYTRVGQVISRQRNPVLYWLVVAIYATVAGICLYRLLYDLHMSV